MKPDPRTCFRWSAGLLTAGLAIEIVTLHWAHPTAFLVFALAGGGLVAVGILAYFWALVS